MTRLKLLFGAAAIVLAMGGVVATVAAETPRQDAMKEIGKNMKAIKGVIDAGGPAADVVAPAQKIAEIAAKIPDLFPAGSDTADDEASAKIWESWDEFTAKSAPSSRKSAAPAVPATRPSAKRRTDTPRVLLGGSPASRRAAVCYFRVLR